MSNNIAKLISDGNAVLGIEMGSTRIKAVLIDADNNVVASGSHSWENRLENGVFTYHLDDVWNGIRDSYENLKSDVKAQYNVTITNLKAIGFSAMMHGYLVFDKEGNQLCEFRTWRNTMTGDAAKELTSLLNFNIPQRWSIAHLYQAMLNKESHINDISFMTTLAGYVHYELTGEKVLGVGEASGMFPIGESGTDFDENKLNKFDECIKDFNLKWQIRDILPKVLMAGDNAGTLTKEGALLLDKSGELKSGIPLCPPEGDAGTGMVATNSVAKRTGNVSAGTSIFAMAVLEKPLKGVYEEIDMVTTPTGKPVAMVHCNNCTSDLDAWVSLIKEINEMSGGVMKTPALYDALYAKALEGDADCDDIISFNYFSGEPVTGLESGRPVLMRKPDSKFSLGNFMRSQLYATMGTLRIGMDILFDKENVKLDCLYGHGGLFKTKIVGQRLMAGAMNTPVAVMETAGEGGAWGIALLASYLVNKSDNETLEDYLNSNVFSNDSGSVINPVKEDVDGFNKYLSNYKASIAVEKAATVSLK